LVRDILGCEVGSLPFQYLGLPLGIRKVSAAQLQPVVDNAMSIVQPWCAKLMNHGGRAILIQTMLSSMLVHAFDVPGRST
jgi:hypothetical protein